MMSDARIFVDEFHNSHVADQELGRGGQGVVLRARDRDTAIKLVLHNEMPVTDPDRRALYAKRLRTVRTLPVPPGLPLAVPLALLERQAGYVMRLLDDMEPLARLFPDAARAATLAPDSVPHWLGDLYRSNPSDAGMLVHYLRSGGLRLRLAALSKCASILARLHGAGLVYGDVSPSNVYLSADGNRVWLIDADNLRYEAAEAAAIYTPYYGAPELVQGKGGAGFRTDCHAFATMAFYVLTLAHPFLGRLVEEACDWETEGDGGPDMTSQALAGLLPWIHDELDTSNALERGLPRSLVLNEPLCRLFQETFGPGRTQPCRRPAVFHWAEALARAADLTVRCACGMSYFGDRLASCPYCGVSRPLLLVCEAHDWPLRNGPPSWVFQRELPDGTGRALALPHRLFAPFSHASIDDPVVTLTAEGSRFLLEGGDDAGLALSLAQPQQQGGLFRRLLTHRLTTEDLRQGVTLFAQGERSRLVRLFLLDGRRA